MAEEKKERNPIDDVKKYEYAALAGSFTHDKDRLQYSLVAMDKLYNNFGLKGDPIIQRAFAQASAGIRNGHITDNALFEAMSVYGDRFNKAYLQSKVSDIIAYVDYNDIPAEVKAIIDKYHDKSAEDLQKEVKELKGKKDDGSKTRIKEIDKVLHALDILKNQRLEGNLYPKLVKESTKQSLESLIERAEH